MGTKLYMARISGRGNRNFEFSMLDPLKTGQCVRQ